MATSKNLLHRTFGLDAKSHGENDRTKLVLKEAPQVINLGLSRTGTTSIDLALKILGFGPGHQGVELYRHPSHREDFISFFTALNAGTTSSSEHLSVWLQQLLQGYRSAGDGPINSLVKESFMAFPHAKYILSVRDGGSSAWWKSLDQAMGWPFRSDWIRLVFRTLIYPVGFLRRQDDFVQLTKAKRERDCGTKFGPAIYDLHNAQVRKTIPPRQLLEYNVKEGWGPLCAFLEVPVPDEKFPNINDMSSMRRIYLGMQMYGAFVWMLYGSLLLATIWCLRLLSSYLTW